MTQYANDGTWKVNCPVCGFNFYSDQMVRRWDGVYVDRKCWEPRHPMDFFQVRPEDNNLPFSKPEGEHRETDTSDWGGIGSFQIDGVYAIAEEAIPDESISG